MSRWTVLAAVIGIASYAAAQPGGGTEPGTGSLSFISPEGVNCPLKKDSTTTPAYDPPLPPRGPSTPVVPREERAVCCVYTHSGEQYATVVDMQIAGRGLDVVWARKYRSRYGPTTALGHGWDYAYNVYLENQYPDLVLHDGNTRADTYYFDGIDTWTAPEFFYEIQQNEDLSFTMTFRDTGTWNFHPFDGSPWQGKLNSIVDRNGNVVALEYDGFGQLTTVWDTLGRPVTIACNVDGFIETVTDFAGRAVSYEYYVEGEPGGSFGDLKSVTTPAVVGTPNGNDFPDGKTTTYTYTAGFPDESLNHDLLSITDGRGETYLQNAYAHTIDATDFRYTIDPTEIHYDRVVRQIWGSPDDIIDLVYVEQVPLPENNFAVIKAIANDRVGNVKEVFCDAMNRTVVIDEYTGRAPNPDGPTTDVDNRPVGQLRPEDPPVFRTLFEYNADALVTRIVHPNGNEETFVYDTFNPSRRAQSNMLAHCRLPGPLGGDQEEICESFEYADGFGGCCGTNFVTRHVDGRGFETLHEYDGNGNRVHTTHRVPTAMEDWEYNAHGQVTAHVWPDNDSGHRRRDEFTYHEAGPQTGHLHQEIVDAGGLALTTNHEYDLVGNVVRTIDPRGNDTLYDVNQLNQVVRETSREVEPGTGIRYEKLRYYDEANNVVRVDVLNVDENGAIQPNAYFTTTYEYDSLNRLVRLTQEVSESHEVVTEYAYDANGNCTLVRFGEATNGHDPDNVQQMLYDERNLLFQEIRAPASPYQSTTQFDYDGNENLVRTSAGLEALPRVTFNVYDGYGRVVMSSDAMDNATWLHYDANGNLVHLLVEGELIDLPGGAGNVRLREVSYTYDGLDRRIETSTSHFDPATQLPIGDGLSVRVVEYSDNSQVVRDVDDNGHEALTTYDTANRISSVTDAKGNAVSYAYDANSNVVALTEVELADGGGADEIYYTNYTYDGLDRRISETNTIGLSHQYGYDSRDNTTLAIDADGDSTRYSYDGLDRRIETTYDMDGDGADGDGADIVLVQTWDDSSRLTSETDDQGNVTTYSYDPLNRLISESYFDGTVTHYDYDPHGNRTLHADANGTVVMYEYDSLNRLIGKMVMPGPGVSPDTTFEGYEYDGLSRLVNAMDDDASLTRAYDSLGYVTSEMLNGRLTTATYDGEGNRLTCTYPGGRQITYSYDPLNRIQQVSEGPIPIASYLHVGPARVLSRDLGNGTRVEYAYDGQPPNPPEDFGVKQIVGTTHSMIDSGDVIDERAYTWAPTFSKTSRNDERAGGPQLRHAYSYDAIDRLISTVVTGTADTPVRDTTYTLDGAGNREEVVGGPDAGLYVMDPALPTPGDLQTNQYTYTPGGRRTYDENGNLTLVAAPGDCDGDGDVDAADFTPGLTECMGGPDNEVAGACTCYDVDHDRDIDLADFAVFQHTFRGSDMPLGVTFAYDYRNRLVERHDHASSLHTTYSYDPLGRRIGKVVDVDGMAGGPFETHYFYDDDRVIEEQDAAGSTPASYVYGGYVDEVLTMRRQTARGEQDYYYHTDDQYAVVAITDASGGVLERYEYGDYGAPTISAAVRGPNLDELFDSDLDPNPLEIAQLIGDSVTFAQPATITAMRWWGGYSYAAGVPTDDFTIQVYSDSGNSPGTLLWEAQLGDDVARVATGAIITSAEGDVAEYVYEATVAPPFAAQPGMYWLVILNDTTGHPTTWGWEASDDGDGDIIWSHNGDPWGHYPANTAFELFTDRSAVGNPYLFSGRRYDEESELYYYRARYLQSSTGRFTTRDPVGIWADPYNLGAGTTYVGNNPWSRLDPHGEITITRVSFQEKDCGGWDVKWTFSLDSAAPCDGYIVQNVTMRWAIADCGASAKFQSKTFWESWKIKKGGKVSWDTARDKWTDNSKRPSRDNKCGIDLVTGVVKFFCTKKTGDLGDLGKKPAKANDGWGPGAVPTSGGLPSTGTKPPWWGGQSAGGEKTATRGAGAIWDCCRTPELNVVVAFP